MTSFWGGESLHPWMFAAISEQIAIDSDFAARGEVGLGATVMGRNMFGPIRGPWGEEEWRGWWGDDPPYHHPVFVLSHHPHDSIEMDGGDDVLLYHRGHPRSS
ncbi:MAG: hypothetical protein ACRDWA_19020 [Acidimicrobiia bacterium]